MIAAHCSFKCVGLYLLGQSIVLPTKMMIEAARAVIRHDTSFSPEAFYEHGGLRYVKLMTVWASKRRFRCEVGIRGFYLELKEAKNRDNTPMFTFWGDETEPIDHNFVWVTCPHRNR